jgi:hypothetical protein
MGPGFDCKGGPKGVQKRVIYTLLGVGGSGPLGLSQHFGSKRGSKGVQKGVPNAQAKGRVGQAKYFGFWVKNTVLGPFQHHLIDIWGSKSAQNVVNGRTSLESMRWSNGSQGRKCLNKGVLVEAVY